MRDILRSATGCGLGMGGNVKSKIVILIHGIRTAAWWQTRVASIIEDNTEATAIPLKYGYFDTLRFLCPFGICRRGPIERLRKEIEGIREQYPGQPLIVLAHSYGTYAFTKILMENPHFKFERVMLCGSIVPETYDWGRVDDQLTLENKREAIVNDCGLRDVWPVIAKSVTWGYGASGTYGFGTFNVRDRFHNLDHSGFFNDKFVRENWIPAIKGDAIQFSEIDKREVPSRGWFDVFRFPFRWFVPLAAIYAVLHLGGLKFGALWQGCKIGEEWRQEVCVVSADLVSKKQLRERYQNLKIVMNDVLEIKAGELFRAMDAYVAMPSDEHWKEVLVPANKLAGVVNGGLADIESYNRFIKDVGHTTYLLTSDGDVEINRHFWRAFDEAAGHFKGRSNIVASMISQLDLPSAEEVTMWRARLSELHQMLEFALDNMILHVDS